MNSTTAPTDQPTTQQFEWATFAKLRDGTWGIKGHESQIQAGKHVPIAKRDGTMTLEQVGRVVWTGGGQAIATIVARPRTRSYVERCYRGHTSARPGCHSCHDTF